MKIAQILLLPVCLMAALPITAFALKEGDIIQMTVGTPSPQTSGQPLGFSYEAEERGACVRVTYDSYLKKNANSAKLKLVSCQNAAKDNDCKLQIVSGDYNGYYVELKDGYAYAAGSSDETFNFIKVSDYSFSSKQWGSYSGTSYKLKDNIGRFPVTTEQHSSCGIYYLRFNTKDQSSSDTVNVGN